MIINILSTDFSSNQEPISTTTMTVRAKQTLSENPKASDLILAVLFLILFAIGSNLSYAWETLEPDSRSFLAHTWLPISSGAKTYHKGPTAPNRLLLNNVLALKDVKPDLRHKQCLKS